MQKIVLFDNHLHTLSRHYTVSIQARTIGVSDMTDSSRSSSSFANSALYRYPFIPEQSGCPT